MDAVPDIEDKQANIEWLILAPFTEMFLKELFNCFIHLPSPVCRSFRGER